MNKADEALMKALSKMDTAEKQTLIFYLQDLIRNQDQTDEQELSVCFPA